MMKGGKYMSRPSWKPSAKILTEIKNDIGNHGAELFHTKYRISKSRCTNPNDKDYELYKGKFKFNTFVDFYTSCYDIFKIAYLKNPNETTIDRIDGDKGYEHGNIRFVSMSENLKNKRICIVTKITNVETMNTKIFRTFGEARKYLNGSGAMFKAMKDGRLYRGIYKIEEL